MHVFSLSIPQFSLLIFDTISDVIFGIQSNPRFLCVLPLERRSVTWINRAGLGPDPGYVTLWTTMSFHSNFVTFPSDVSVLFRRVLLMSFGFVCGNISVAFYTICNCCSWFVAESCFGSCISHLESTCFFFLAVIIYFVVLNVFLSNVDFCCKVYI